MKMIQQELLKNLKNNRGIMIKKFGFTLIEILIVMAIIGIITTIGVSTYSSVSSNHRYIYSNIYHSLDQAIFNAMNYRNMDNPFDTVDAKTRQAVSEDEQVKRLCLIFTEYLDTFSASCTDNISDRIMPISATDDDFANRSPFFITSNGVRFYISKRYTGDDDVHSFFIVFADSNGEKGPNSMHYDPGTQENHRVINPDIFAFAVLDIGRVCPLGPPEIDDKFMLTRIRYLNAEEDERYAEFADVGFSEPSKPYYISKAEAWGYYLPAQRVGGSPVSQGFYIDDNPYSYNEYVRDVIGEDSLIYENVPSMTAALANYEAITSDQIWLRGQYGDDKDERKSGRYYGCRRVSDDECQVIIDKYMF